MIDAVLSPVADMGGWLFTSIDQRARTSIMGNADQQFVIATRVVVVQKLLEFL